MVRNKKIEQNDIIFFQKESTRYDCSQLKHFINFLYFQGFKRPLNFSHVDKEALLIKNLSLKDNIFLESIPNSLKTSKALQLDGLLKQTGNIHLLNLFEQLGNLDVFPEEVDSQKKKIVGLIKSLINKNDFIFLEHPENHLDEATCKLFTKALLQQENVRREYIVLIHSQKQELWIPYANKIVGRDLQGKFLVTHLRNEQIKIQPMPRIGHLDFLIPTKKNQNEAA